MKVDLTTAIKMETSKGISQASATVEVLLHNKKGHALLVHHATQLMRLHPFMYADTTEGRKKAVAVTLAKLSNPRNAYLLKAYERNNNVVVQAPKTKEEYCPGMNVFMNALIASGYKTLGQCVDVAQVKYYEEHGWDTTKLHDHVISRAKQIVIIGNSINVIRNLVALAYNDFNVFGLPKVAIKVPEVNGGKNYTLTNLAEFNSLVYANNKAFGSTATEETVTDYHKEIGYNLECILNDVTTTDIIQSATGFTTLNDLLHSMNNDLTQFSEYLHAIINDSRDFEAEQKHDVDTVQVPLGYYVDKPSVYNYVDDMGNNTTSCHTEYRAKLQYNNETLIDLVTEALQVMAYSYYEIKAMRFQPDTEDALAAYKEIQAGNVSYNDYE